MIHVELFGEQVFIPNGPGVRIDPFSTRVDDPGNLTVDAVAVAAAIIGFGSGLTFIVNFRNMSAGGQTIGIDTTNGVTIANAGILLFPGESIQLINVSTPFFAIASAAGGELRRWSARTT